ncbi:nucleotidyltransferase domain-containing protein [Amycolatopsis sp. NPDC049688]|uniref:nucleotidyltransferase domain-containing protein n=1 Tax=Amycolatopsis sp. NPDC049688 TaxID=3154733 RepID=UPI00343C2200
MKRSRATALVEDLLGNLTSSEWPIPLVESVSVFGSYARGALEPADVDIAVDFHRDERWTRHFVHCMSYSKNPFTVFTRALRGNTRSVSIIFEPQNYPDIPMTLLWQKGEAVETALERLRAIPADPDAGRAPRDGMLPCFAGIDKWVPRPVREEIACLVEDGVITVEQLTLADNVVTDLSVKRIIDSLGSRRVRCAAPHWRQ